MKDNEICYGLEINIKNTDNKQKETEKPIITTQTVKYKQNNNAKDKEIDSHEIDTNISRQFSQYQKDSSLTEIIKMPS